MNGHWTGQALTTTEIHLSDFTVSRPTLSRYRSENSRLNTVLHSVHKRVFGQS